MKTNRWITGLCAAAALVGCAADTGGADEARTASAITNGALVSEATQRSLGVVGVLHTPSGMRCTGTLLRAGHVLTAQHCAYGDDASNYVFTLGAETHRGSAGTTPLSLARSIPSGALYGDAVLISLDAPFVSVANTANPDAPYHRVIYAGDTASLVGQTVRCVGLGNNTYNPATGACTWDGTTREANFEVHAVSRSYIPSNPSPADARYSFELWPHDGVLPVPGDSGSTCFFGDTAQGHLTGVLSQSACGGSYALYTAPILFADAIAERLGALQSPKGIYAITPSAGLREYWHIGMNSMTPSWRAGDVGVGWTFRQVVNSGSVVYAVDASGNLHWYRHDGFYNLTADWGARQGVVVNSGWRYRHLVVDSNVLLALDNAGNVYSFQHTAFDVGRFENVRVGEPEWRIGSGRRIASLPYDITHMAISGRNLYFRTRDGVVYMTSTVYNIEGVVGLTPFSLVGALPDVVDLIVRGGFLYYTTSSGALMQVEHTGQFHRLAGLGTPALVGSGWQGFQLVGSSRAQTW